MGPLQIIAATLLATAAGKECYDCGYQVNNWHTGSNVQEEHPLPGISQCGDEAMMESNVVECASGDECCGSVKEFYIYGDVDGRPGHIDMVARHACEKTLADRFSFDVICNDHVNACFNVTYEDIQEQEAAYASACFCEGDKCNNNVPAMPPPTTEAPENPTTTSCPECRQCFSCGYRKAGEDGESSALPELAFCSDFSTPVDIVATCALGDCCGSLKEYIIKVDENTGENSTEIIGQHGCVWDIDHLSQYSATCNDNGESCFQVDDADLPHDGNSTIVKAEICMCDRDRCNDDDPFPEFTTTTVATESGCSNVALQFSTSSYADSKLLCYDDMSETEDDKKETEVREQEMTMGPGTSCVFLSTGHMDQGFVIELYCDQQQWVVTLVKN